MMWRSLGILWVLCGGLDAVAAQQGEAGRVEERRRAERRLNESQYEVERLLEMRLRHDLGLIGELDDNMVRSDTPPTTAAMDRMQRELDNEVASAAIMRQRYEQLQRAVQLLRKEAEAAAPKEPGEFVVVAPIGSESVAPPGAGASSLPPSGRPSGSISGLDTPYQGHVPAAPGPEGRRPSGALTRQVLGPLALEPLQAQIHGSRDHQRVAQALFKAGQALMDRAEVLRERGENEIGRQLDERAKQRLEHAIRELKPLLAAKEPPFVALFYLGKCREMLFRYSERHEGLSLSASASEFRRREQDVREPFLQISARDISKTGPADSVDVLGVWGQAATTAMEHFRWMNVNAGYSARAAIEALSWPGDDSR